MMICRLTLPSCPSKPQPESLHCSCGRVRLPCLLMVACDEGEKKLIFGAVPGPRDKSCRFRWLWGGHGGPNLPLLSLYHDLGCFVLARDRCHTGFHLC